MAASRKKRTSAKRTSSTQRAKAETPLQRTAEVVAAQLQAMGCDPIQGVAEIAMDVENAATLRAGMFKELAQYMVAKPRAGSETNSSEDKNTSAGESDLSRFNTAELKAMREIYLAAQARLKAQEKD